MILTNVHKMYTNEKKRAKGQSANSELKQLICKAPFSINV